ncbi:hypothetical protein ETH_00034100, partial [Eimeria tenella]
VDWSEEIVCLHGIAFLLAEAYTTVDDSSAAVPAEATAAAEEASAESNEHARLQHQQKQDQSSSSSNTLLSQQKACLREEAATQRDCSDIDKQMAASPETRRMFSNVLMPALRFYWKAYIPNCFFSDGTVKELTNLKALYRVFERC